MGKIPFRYIPVGAFLGDQESSESLVLSGVVSSGGSRNVWIDKLGRATSILGYTKQNAAAVTSDVGGAALRLRALYPYGLQHPDGSLTRQVLGVFDAGPGGTHFEIRVSTDSGQTWPTVLADLGAAFVDRVPDFAQLGNALAVAFGFGAIKSYDGITWDDASTAQSNQPAVTINATDGFLDGTYRWRIVSVKADGDRKASSTDSATLTVHQQSADLTWAADNDAVSYEVYRTTGQNRLFFFEAAVDSDTLAFTSSMSDLTLITGRALQEHGDAPPDNIRFVEAHGERLWYGGSGAHPRRWWFGDPGLPYSVYRDANYIDFTDEESFTDQSTGATGNFGGLFVVWLERSVWTVSGDGVFIGAILDYVRRRTDAQQGTVSHRTVARIPAGSRWIDVSGQTVTTGRSMLAYLTPLGDLRLFDGNNDQIISWAKQDTFRRLSYVGRRKAFCLSDLDHDEVTWVFPVDGALEPNYAVSWNLKTGTMTERQWGFGCGIRLDTDDDANVLLAGEANLATGGYVYRLWDGQTFDGASIGARVTTKTFYARDKNGNELLHVTNCWRWVDLLVKCDGPLDLLVEWWSSEAKDDDPPAGSDTISLSGSALLTSDDSVLETSDGSALHAAVSPAVLRVKLRETATAGNLDLPRYLHSRGMRLRISSTTARTWSLVGLLVAYQPLSGVKREFRR